MYTTYHLNSAQDITEDIIEAIKKVYKSKPIAITITEELDTTTYLVESPTNKAIILESIEQANKNNFIEKAIDDL